MAISGGKTGREWRSSASRIACSVVTGHSFCGGTTCTVSPGEVQPVKQSTKPCLSAVLDFLADDPNADAEKEITGDDIEHDDGLGDRMGRLVFD